MTAVEEQSVIQQVLEGDTERYATLLNCYAPQVLRLVSGMVQNREDAEEITQDTFLRAFDRLSSFRMESSFSTWLYRIAYNLALNFLRKNSVQRTSLSDTMAEAEASLCAEEEEREDNREDKVAVLQRTIKTLPAEDQLLLKLYYEEEKPVRETAYVLGIKEGAVKTKLFRIRQKIEEKMEEYGNK